MKEYVEKQKIDYHIVKNIKNYRDDSEKDVYDIDMDEIMKMFSDLLNPKRIINESQQIIDNKDLKKSSDAIKNLVNNDDFDFYFPDKNQNYISNYLMKEHKVT